MFRVTADGPRRKKERVVGVSKINIDVATPVQPHCSHQFWYLIPRVCQPSYWDLSSTASPPWPDLSGCLYHIPCCSPTWGCYSCLAAPGRLAQPLCSADVSSKGNGNLAAAFTQSRRPSWLQFMAKVLGLGVISLCKYIYTGSAWVLFPVLESSWNIWLCGGPA